MGVYGIELFSKRYLGNFDLNVWYCGIIFIRLANGIRKIRSFTVLRYCSFSLSCLKQVNILKKIWYGIQDHLMTELFRWLYRSI